MEKGLKKLGGSCVHLERKELRVKRENTNNILFHLGEKKKTKQIKDVKLLLRLLVFKFASLSCVL